MTNIPFTDFGGIGEAVHFAHANGYPPGCYGEFMELVKREFSVSAMHYRPLWDDNHHQLTNWKLFSTDLVKFMNQQGLKNTIGFGHSMGAITSLVAAVQQPDLFRKLIMIEPVVLPKNLYFTRRLPLFLAKKMIPIAKITQKRRDRWESKEALFESFRKKKVFSRISDQGIWLYAEHATKPHPEGGITLAYSKQWETQVYCTAIYPWKYIRKIDIPVLIIRAQYTDVLIDKTWEQLQASLTNATFVDMKDVGHLVPLEEPEKVFNIIMNWLQNSA